MKGKRMNNRQSLYLLWATILNQSQSAETVLKNTFELFKRLNLLSNFDKEYKNLNYENIEKGISTKPCLHRFPRNMSILKQFREFEGNDTCNNCKEYNNCRGGCRYRCFKDGDINGVDPFCYLRNNSSS